MWRPAFTDLIDQTDSLLLNDLSAPGVTNASCDEDTQTTSGLVVTPNAADVGLVDYFKVVSISSGDERGRPGYRFPRFFEVADTVLSRRSSFRRGGDYRYRQVLH